MRYFALMLLLVAGSVAVATPIPKSLKKLRAGGDPNGVWQLTKFSSNGMDGGHENMAKYWEIDGELFFIGIPAPDNRGQVTGNAFKIRDADDPCLRIFGSSRSRLKVEGDTLAWVYTAGSDSLAECEPGPNRYYYEFKRVK